ncbi:MAG: hypothetical protein K6G11_01145 [Lachnospiraceae bacterium]|nr:hypothetical protein [Lachnospiraceae bacterium]
MSNPFTPNFGKVPKIFLDRESSLEKIVNGISDFDSPYQTTLICGQRGTGKTAFLTDVCNKIKNDKNWIVVNLIPNGNMMQPLIQSIYKQSSSAIKKTLDAIKGVKISAFGVEIEYRKSNNITDYQILFEDILEKLKKNNIHLLISIDEVTNTPEIRDFASIYQLMIREEFYLSLIMTGLPKNISELQNDKQLTFLLRSMRIELPTLNPLSVKMSYKNVFTQKITDDDILTNMAKMVDGYAYAFQLLGYLVWNHKDDFSADTLDIIAEDYKHQLYRNAYTKIYQELSDMDKKFISTMANLESVDISMKDIENGMQKSKSYISNYRSRLIEAGVIQQVGWGKVRFKLPYFKDFILEYEKFF